MKKWLIESPHYPEMVVLADEAYDALENYCIHYGYDSYISYCEACCPTESDLEVALLPKGVGHA